MTAPRFARLASKALAPEEGGGAPRLTSGSRARAIAAIEVAIAARARRRRRTRWVSVVAAAAAVVAATVGVSRHFVHRGQTAATASAPAATASHDVGIVAHDMTGGASIIAAGSAAPLPEGRPLAQGSRIVTPTNGRVLLAFATGTSAVLQQGADLTVNNAGGEQNLALDSGSVSLHVAKLGADERFLVHTRDTEVEVRGTAFQVTVAPSDPSCGGGTTTRVAVTEGVVVVRHAGVESRVAAGELWPSGCDRPASPPAPTAIRAPAVPPSSGPGSTLGDQNDLFAAATAAKRRGDTSEALAGFSRFLVKYPSSPLAESASVERMRLLRSSDSPAAPSAARQYLARYPGGFAHAEAEAIVAGSP